MLLRRIARPLLASWFVAEGVDALVRPDPHVRAARASLDLADRATRGQVPAADDRVLRAAVRAHGAVTAAAGACLALGRAPRTAALVLALSTAPLAVSAAVAEPATGSTTRGERRRQVLRPVALTGAALLAAADTEGRPGLGWRVEQARAAREAAKDESRSRTGR